MSQDRTDPPVAVIFDIDGVVIDSPHERAWREALTSASDQARFTSAFYQAHVAGKPRLDGAQAILAAFAASDTPEAYAARKQMGLQQLIAAGAFSAFPDALRLLIRLRQAEVPIAAASSSKNANAMLEQITVPPYGTLRMLFTANLCGQDQRRGKPDPAIFLAAAEALDQPPGTSVVVEDAPAGIQAARAGGMAALGVARHNDAAGLWAAGANRVVSSLDDIAVATLRALPSTKEPR